MQYAAGVPSLDQIGVKNTVFQHLPCNNVMGSAEKGAHAHRW